MGQYCFARWNLSSKTLPAGGRAGRRARGRPSLYGGPVGLRPIRAIPCLITEFGDLSYEEYSVVKEE